MDFGCSTHTLDQIFLALLQTKVPITSFVVKGANTYKNYISILNFFIRRFFGVANVRELGLKSFQ